MPDEKQNYLCTACGHVAPYDDFLYSEHDPVNDGWVEGVRCPECGDEKNIQKAGVVQ